MAGWQLDPNLIRADADARIAEPDAEAARANVRADQLELEIGQQRERTARAERDPIELQQTIADRSLASSQHDRLVDALERVPGVVTVSCVAGNAEPSQFASQLKEVLQEGGWEVIDGGSFSVLRNANATVVDLGERRGQHGR